MSSKKETFEASLQELEAVVARLESGDLPLDEALTCFEDGVRAAGRCQTLLKEAELKIEQLTRDSDGALQLAPLETDVAEDDD